MSVTDLPHGKKLDSGGNAYIQKSMAEVLDEFKGGEVEQPLNCAIPFGGAIYYDYNENSVAEFLDSLQEKSGPPQGSCEMVVPYIFLFFSPNPNFLIGFFIIFLSG